MKKQIDLPRLLTRKEAERRAERILHEIQKDLLPEHASRLVAINLENGLYLVGDHDLELAREFRRRFPDQIPYIVRVDGGPVVKFHGM